MNQNAAASCGIKMVEVSGVITRADGTREDLGVLSRWDRSPFRRFMHRFNQWVRGKSAGRIHFTEF